MAWVERQTILYKLENLPFDAAGKVTIIDPSKVVLVVKDVSSTIDIGSWCYSKKKTQAIVNRFS